VEPKAASGVRLDVPIPPGAEERSHEVVMAAFASHRPTPARRSHWRPAIAVAVVAVFAGVLASPPGRSVIHAIREAVGVKKAQRELFSLPAPGRLLVNSARGAWVVDQNGSKRLLGPYHQASWSPFGRFVVALRGDELVTLEPDGNVHWTLARPGLRVPSWGGERDDTRIAYLSRGNLHVVAGDSTGDATRCADSVAPVTPVWKPGSLSVLAFASVDGRIHVYDVTDCRLILRKAVGPVRKLQWSRDGKLLLALSRSGVRVYDLRGHVVEHVPGVEDAVFVGPTHRIALIRGGNALVGFAGVFRATGLRQVVSSPDGRWLLLTWPAANQWVFVRVGTPHTIRAFAGITRQLGGGRFPAVSGWIGE
jgi:hypothetical protein